MPQLELTAYDADDEEAYENGHKQEESTDYSYLFESPDYASFVRRTKTAKAKEYETKTASILKTAMIGCINSHNFEDAAAIIDRGPAFAAATGMFCDANELAAKTVDLITSPESPLAMFVMTAIPLISQIVRNHEPQIKEAATTAKKTRAETRKARKEAKEKGIKFTARVKTVKLFGRQFSIPVMFKMPKLNPGILIAGFRSQTEYPQSLTHRVFSDKKVQDALRKQGVFLQSQETADETPT